jgi:hypothetical protein
LERFWQIPLRLRWCTSLNVATAKAADGTYFGRYPLHGLVTFASASVGSGLQPAVAIGASIAGQLRGGLWLYLVADCWRAATAFVFSAQPSRLARDHIG